MSGPKIAIVYDRINKFGGAEQVLLALHRQFPDAPLYTSVFDRRGAAWVGNWEVHTSFIQHIPFAKSHHEWFGWLMPLAFESLDLSSFDIIISVTSEAAKGIISHPDQLHICYCLTPTRYLWSHTHEYGKGTYGFLKRWIFSGLRAWDYIASTRPDKMIAISEHVAKRIEKYYGRKVAGIVSPPVKQPVTSSQQSVARLPARQVSRENFLVVGRLVPYKKIDLAIRACVQANKRLVIVGTGSDEARLKKIAGESPLISFAGFVPDEELEKYYVQAIALICPQEEDFGIVSVEAQSHGTPVISYAKSGMVETIVPEKTGLIFEDDLVSALEHAEQIEWNRERISAHAQNFSEEKFAHHWQRLVDST